MILNLPREIAGSRTADFCDKQDVVHVRANTQAADDFVRSKACFHIPNGILDVRPSADPMVLIMLISGA